MEEVWECLDNVLDVFDQKNVNGRWAEPNQRYHRLVTKKGRVQR